MSHPTKSRTATAWLPSPYSVAIPTALAQLLVAMVYRRKIDFLTKVILSRSVNVSMFFAFHPQSRKGAGYLAVSCSIAYRSAYPRIPLLNNRLFIEPMIPPLRAQLWLTFPLACLGCRAREKHSGNSSDEACFHKKGNKGEILCLLYKQRSIYFACDRYTSVDRLDTPHIR
jgi:hypothetical protein